MDTISGGPTIIACMNEVVFASAKIEPIEVEVEGVVLGISSAGHYFTVGVSTV